MANRLIVYDFDPRNLPPEYLQRIGLLVAASAQTEHILKDFIGSLLGIDNIQTSALATHMNIQLKQDILRTLAELQAPDTSELDKLDDLLDAAKEAFEARNAFVHNQFAIHPTTKEIFIHRLTARGSLQLEFKPISCEEIEKIAATMYQVGMDISAFMISRGLDPIQRTKPLREPINRKKKARTERRNSKLDRVIV